MEITVRRFFLSVCLSTIFIFMSIKYVTTTDFSVRKSPQARIKMTQKFNSFQKWKPKKNLEHSNSERPFTPEINLQCDRLKLVEVRQRNHFEIVCNH